MFLQRPSLKEAAKVREKGTFDHGPWTIVEVVMLAQPPREVMDDGRRKTGDACPATAGDDVKLLKPLKLGTPKTQIIDIRYIQELLGHSKPETTMIYTHVARKDALAISSPLDDDLELKPVQIPVN